LKKELNFTLVVVILAITAVIVVGFTGYFTSSLKKLRRAVKKLLPESPVLKKRSPKRKR